jgi:hypothetical protein
MGPATLTSPASVYISNTSHVPGGLSTAPLGDYRILHANLPYQPQWPNPSPFSNTAFAIRVLDKRRNDIHVSILATNLFAIASIARLRQHDFLFEFVFIKKPNLLQLILAVVSWIFAGLHYLSDEGAGSECLSRDITPSVDCVMGRLPGHC